jgi:hypothetical protein
MQGGTRRHIQCFESHPLRHTFNCPSQLYDSPSCYSMLHFCGNCRALHGLAARKLNDNSNYGKVVDDLSVPTGVAIQRPQDGGTLHAGHNLGYPQGHRCFRFTPPRIYMLPDPSGPADGCGWDPAQFVVWELPPDWLTLYFEVQHEAIGDSLIPIIGGDSRLSTGQCITIASDCVFDETGNPQPVDRSRSLLSYGINSPEQASGVRTRIV